MATDEEMKTWLGKKPYFERTVTYAYSPQMNAFTFFTPSSRGKGMEPIGVFTPLYKQGITYDVEAIVEELAEHMSYFPNEETYDIECDDN